MTHNKILAISLLLMGAAFASCSSTEDTATDNNTGNETKKQTYLVFNNVSKNPDMAAYVNSKSTRLTPADNTLQTNGSFGYTWEKGDTLYVIKSDGSRAIIRAQSSGTTVPFTGTSSLQFTNNEALVLLTPTTNSTFSSDGKSIAFETFNNTGKITDAVKRNPLFGTTTVSSVTTAADNNITVKIADATCNALFSIVCCYIKTGTDDPNFIAASIMANDTIFPTSVSLNLSDTSGTLTKGPNYLDYVRGTMNKANEYFPTLTNGSGQHLSKIYLCVVPGMTLQAMKVSAFQALKAYYRKGITFDSEITFEKSKYYQVVADFTSGATEVDAYTKPGMPYSLSPGLLHAYRSSTSEPWQYEYYKDQGYMKGYAEQTPLSAEYFCWGEPDPMKVTHYTFNNWTGTNAPTYSDIVNASETVKAPTSYTALPTLASSVPGGSATETYTSLNYGIKALVTVNGVGYGVDPARMASGGFFRSPTTTEANYLLKGLNTPNYWCVYKYNSTSVTGDNKTTWGFYLGTSDQAAASANQDNYVFVPLTGDLNNKNASDGEIMKKTGRYIGANYTNGTTTTGYLYPIGTQEMFDCNTDGYKAAYYDTDWETLITNHVMPFAQFSSWTCQQPGSNKANRYIFERKSDTEISSDCGGREIGYARAIRGVAH